MGSGITTLNWYNYGKTRFLKNGYQKAEARLKAALDQTRGASDGMQEQQKVIAITGANSGIGKAMTKQLTERGHQVVMMCRSEQRAEDARKDILEELSHIDSVSKPQIVIADCSDPDSLVNAVNSLETNHLDALVINAGALLDQYRGNANDTHEFNLSVFVLHGFHLLTRLCLPYLKESSDPRVVVVSSGGMYRVPLSMRKLVEVTPATYDAVEAYCQGKRAQVILTERFAKEVSDVNFYCCHPGWGMTQGVKSTNKLDGLVQWTGAENWRSPEESALGVSYLAVEKSSALVNGEFYLDGEIAPKHLPGNWYNWMGSDTKCSQRTRDELWAYCEESNASFL